MHYSTNYKQFISTDYGVTWDNGTLMTTSNYYHKQPNLIRLPDQRIVFSHGDLLYNLVLEVSSDEGTTWTPHTIMNLATQGYGNVNGPYPDTRLLNDNKTLAIAWCTNLVSQTLSDVYITFADISVLN